MRHFVFSVNGKSVVGAGATTKRINSICNDIIPSDRSRPQAGREKIQLRF